MAITQPGGAGTTIYVYSGTYTFADIAAAFPADFTSLGTNKPSYRARVTVQIGDTTTGTDTTTLDDQTQESTVIWDNGFTLAYRTTQTTSWYTRLGTKVGTGNEASGHKGTVLILGTTTTMRGNQYHYGSTLKATTGACTFLLPSANAGEFVNCLLQSANTAATFDFAFTGNSTNQYDNIYNADFSGSHATAIINNWFFVNAERITVSGATPSRLMNLPAATAITIKDIALFGAPSSCDLAWSISTATGHNIVRPIWTNLANKFGFAGSAATPSLTNATKEYWRYDVKVVDGTGAGIVGIPVRLTDSVGNIQVDTTTNSSGGVDFGSGLTENMVVVLDHYSNGSAYVQRSRSPFEVHINTADLTGYNPSYHGRHYFFNWPGSETITLSSGTFGDVNDVVNLVEPSGNPVNWTECTL